MKKFAILLLCLVVVVALAACGQEPTTPPTTTPDTDGEQTAAPDFSGQSLVVGTWGGTYHESLQATQADFEAATGAKLEFVLGDTPIEQLISEGSNPSYDVCHTDPVLSMIGNKYGIWETLDHAKLSNAADLYEQAFSEDGTSVVSNWGFFGIEYNREFVEDGAVDAWLDYWNPEFAGGKCHIQQVNDGGERWVDIVAREMGFKGIEDTSTWDDLFAKLAEVKPNIGLINNDHAAIETYISQGDVWLAVETNGRALNLVKDGFDIGFVQCELSPTLTTNLNIVKTSHHLDLAYAYVDWLLGEESQTRFMEFNGYNPSNSTIAIPEDLQGYMLADQAAVAGLIQYDTEGFDAVRDQFIDRWNAIFSV